MGSVRLGASGAPLLPLPSLRLEHRWPEALGHRSLSPSPRTQARDHTAPMLVAHMPSDPIPSSAVTGFLAL